MVVEARNVSFVGTLVHSNDAIWECAQCDFSYVTGSGNSVPVDSIEYRMRFDAREVRRAGVPKSRTLTLRTSEWFVSGDLPYLELVVQGQMLEGAPWDRFKPVYERD